MANPASGYVPPYNKANLQQWASAVSTLVQGFQAIATNDLGIESAKVGNIVFISGQVAVEDSILESALPFLPRSPGFVTGVAENGTVVAFSVSEDSRDLGANGIAAGNYLLSGWYFCVPSGG